jgi:hypothetical protein
MQNPLPAATARLWHRLEMEPLLAGWYLVGGSALALRIGHRMSEDLDFAWPDGTKLPVPKVDALVRILESEGWTMERKDNAGSYDEFLIAGMSLHDYQQDFLATGSEGTVKVTFFSPDPPLAKLLPHSDLPSVIVPDTRVLFQTKALVASSRSTVRDWVDLYILMTQHGFTIDDFAAAYEAAGSKLQLDIAFDRLTSGQPRAGDPGVEGLTENPPTVEAMVAYFREELRKWKLARAGKAWRGE